MISAKRVSEIFGECLFRGDNRIQVEGIIGDLEFDSERIEGYRDEIISMLRLLPEQFHADSGGGWSFLQACNTKDGVQWTGLHQRMEELFCLGMAIGKVKYCMPRKMWDMLPGSMPYIVIDLKD